MAKGATVFRNTSCVGETDLCFKYKGQIYEINVKLAALFENRSGSFSWKTKNACLVVPPVYPLMVIPETFADLSGWRCRWITRGNQYGEKICPPGLENFWD